MNSSLKGKKILITREKKQAKDFAEKVKICGGNPIEVPLLEISCKDIVANQRILEHIEGYKWIFFTSANGVDCFFQLAEKYKLPKLKEPKFAVVGHKTEWCLNRHGYLSSFVPSVYNADVMAAEFLQKFKCDGPALLVRGNRSRDVLPVEFSKLDMDFDMMEVYETKFNYTMENVLQTVLLEEELDFITFTSPSTVEAFSEMINNIPEITYVCIGTTTEQRALELGFKLVLTPEVYTTDAMLQTIANYIKNEGEDESV